MRRNPARPIMLTVWIVSILSGVSIHALAGDLDEGIQKGVSWLITRQDRKNGSYAAHHPQPAGTAIVEVAILESRLGYSGPFVTQGYDFILKHKQPKGGVYTAGDGNFSYNTAMALIALLAKGDAQYKNFVENAKAYLMNMQFTEEDGPITPDLWMYGGWGYDDITFAPKPDIFVTSWTLEALKRAGVPHDERLWQRSITFLERCQNLRTIHEQSNDDGGFFFAPLRPQPDHRKYDKRYGRRKASIKSYGSATCAGLKGYLYAGLPKDDEKVQAAYNWLKKYFVLKENPGRGDHELFYYYYALAKALHAYGGRNLPDLSGKTRIWPKMLADYLIKIQHPDGAWHNIRAEKDEQTIRPEQSAELVTAYAIRALSICKEILSK